MGNGLLCCSTGLPVSLTVLLSSPRGLLTPSNDCFPFRNGIFLDKSISCSSSPTLCFLIRVHASLSGHIKPTQQPEPSNAGAMCSQLPSLFRADTQRPGARRRGDPWLRLGLRGWDFGPFPPWPSSSPLPMLEGVGFKVTPNTHLS